MAFELGPSLQIDPLMLSCMLAGLLSNACPRCLPTSFGCKLGVLLPPFVDLTFIADFHDAIGIENVKRDGFDAAFQFDCLGSGARQTAVGYPAAAFRGPDSENVFDFSW